MGLVICFCFKVQGVSWGRICVFWQGIDSSKVTWKTAYEIGTGDFDVGDHFDNFFPLNSAAERRLIFAHWLDKVRGDEFDWIPSTTSPWLGGIWKGALGRLRIDGKRFWHQSPKMYMIFISPAFDFKTFLQVCDDVIMHVALSRCSELNSSALISISVLVCASKKGHVVPYF